MLNGFWKWLMLLWLLIGVGGCNGTLSTGKIALVVDSVPPGIVHHEFAVPGVEASLMIDPWKAIELATDGIAGLLAPGTG